MAKSLDKKKETTALFERGLKHWLRLPHPKVSEREWKAIKWRWEFLRLNANYEKEYVDIEAQKKPKVLPQFNRWKLGEWLNPRLSFGQLYTQIRNEILELEIHEIDVDETAKFLLFLKWERPSSRIPLSHGSSPVAIIDVDLDAPDSENIEKFKNCLHKLKCETKRKLPWDWDKLPKYHKAISLKKQGKSAEEIAQIMFPEPDPMSDDESTPDLQYDSVMRTVFRYLKIGKELVEGAYKDIR